MMPPGSMVWRCAARDVWSWPVAAAARRDGPRGVALQYAVRTGATGRRSVAVHAAPLLDAAAEELHGTTARQVAPLPAAPRGGPSLVVGPLVGLPVQLRPLGRDLLSVGPTSPCSPQSRRHQEKTLQRQCRAEA